VEAPMKQSLRINMNDPQIFAKVYTFDASPDDCALFAQRAEAQTVRHFRLKASCAPETSTQPTCINVYIDALLEILSPLSNERIPLSCQKTLLLFVHPQPTDGSLDTEDVEHIHAENDAILISEIAQQHVLLALPSAITEATPDTNTSEPNTQQKPFANLKDLLQNS